MFLGVYLVLGGYIVQYVNENRKIFRRPRYVNPLKPPPPSFAPALDILRSSHWRNRGLEFGREIGITTCNEDGRFEYKKRPVDFMGH